jgi:hypothetical protein
MDIISRLALQWRFPPAFSLLSGGNIRLAAIAMSLELQQQELRRENAQENRK